MEMTRAIQSEKISSPLKDYFPADRRQTRARSVAKKRASEPITTRSSRSSSMVARSQKLLTPASPVDTPPRVLTCLTKVQDMEVQLAEAMEQVNAACERRRRELPTRAPAASVTLTGQPKKSLAPTVEVESPHKVIPLAMIPVPSTSSAPTTSSTSTSANPPPAKKNRKAKGK